MQNNYPVQMYSQSQQNKTTPKNSLNEHRWHFATALIVPYYQLQFVIVDRVWHWQLTRHALNIKKRGIGYLTVQIVKIGRNSNDKPY